MTYYHTHRDHAQAEADRLELGDDRIEYCRVELEPNNGWVVVAVPKIIDITDLKDIAEIRHPNGNRLAARPADHKKIALPVSKKPSGEPGSAPIKGATARVWIIADESLADKGTIDRADIIARCEQAGINKATAATQFSKWKKTKQ